MADIHPSDGDTVRFHYTASLSDNTKLDSTRDENQPIEVILGKTVLLPGIDRILRTMTEGETIRSILPPAEAFGEPEPGLVQVLDMADFPPHIKPHEDLTLDLNVGGGDRLKVRVTKVDGDAVTVDGNHPLSGQPLAIEIEMLAVNPTASG